jgi:hypothetical protein
MSMEPTQHPSRRAGAGWFPVWLALVVIVVALIVLAVLFL